MIHYKPYLQIDSKETIFLLLNLPQVRTYITLMLSLTYGFLFIDYLRFKNEKIFIDDFFINFIE